MQTTYPQITSVCRKTSAQGRVPIIKYSTVIVVDLCEVPGFPPHPSRTQSSITKDDRTCGWEIARKSDTSWSRELYVAHSKWNESHTCIVELSTQFNGISVGVWNIYTQGVSKRAHNRKIKWEKVIHRSVPNPSSVRSSAQVHRNSISLYGNWANLY